MASKPQPILSQLGALGMIAFFFLPWASCQGEKVSGFDLGGAAWLLPVAGAAVLGFIHYHQSAGGLGAARAPVRVALAVAILAALYLWVDIKFARIGNFNIGRYVRLEPGGAGEAASIGLAMYGSFFLRGDIRRRRSGESEDF